MCESGDVKGCPSCPPEVKDEILLLASQLPKTKKRKLNEEDMPVPASEKAEGAPGRHPGGHGSGRENCCDQALTDLFCEAGISFNVTR